MNHLEKLVLQSIGENVTSPDVFKDTDAGLKPIRDSINSAIEEIAMMTGIYKERYIIPLYDQQGFYRINFNRGDFGYVMSAYLMDQRRKLIQDGIHSIGEQGYRWMTQVGTPTNYVMFGMDVIGLYPRPSGTSGFLELECCVIPERYETSTDRIKIRDDFQKTVVELAVSEYWASRGDASSASKHLGYYIKNLGLDDRTPIAKDKNYQLRTKSEPTGPTDSNSSLSS